MPFEFLRTTAFRNLVDAETRLDSNQVFFVGENGQGKTNFLEAVYFSSYASSFRNARDADFIRSTEADCSVIAGLSNTYADKVSVSIQMGKKSVTIDSKKTEDRKDLLNLISPIVFCHEDMDFISGSPERRRWFFDQSLSMYDQNYIDELRRYRKILKTRNNLLKEKKSELISLIDQQLVFSGIELMKKREKAVLFFSESFEPSFESVSDIGHVNIKYVPSWKTIDPDAILNQLMSKRESEMILGTSSSGPHRDRYHFEKKGHDFANTASTGQKRLLALLLRVAQAKRFMASLERKPVLLLDDVLLELDPEKRKRFIHILPEYDQAFFTILPEEPYQRYKDTGAIVYTVRNGIISA